MTFVLMAKGEKKMRLIDADALSSDICKDCNAVQNGACNYDICPLVAWIEAAPTIEAEPVRHGEWKDNHCTACGMTPLGEELWQHLDVEPPKFEYCMRICPCCGAKMTGRRIKNEYLFCAGE